MKFREKYLILLLLLQGWDFDGSCPSKTENHKILLLQKMQSMSPLLGSYVSRFREQTKEMFRQSCVILPETRGRFTCQICKQNILDYKFQLAEYLTLDNLSKNFFAKDGKLLPL